MKLVKSGRDFDVDLEASHRDRDRWDRFWRGAFPDCRLERVEGRRDLQPLGVDAILIRPTGKQLLVEEKVRDVDYGDCLVEIWSQWYGDGRRENVVGWSIHPDKATDLLAYAIRPRSVCWLLPFLEYRDYCRRLRGLPVKRSTTTRGSRRWETHHISISWDEVCNALRLRPSEACRQW